MLRPICGNPTWRSLPVLRVTAADRSCACEERLGFEREDYAVLKPGAVALGHSQVDRVPSGISRPRATLGQGSMMAKNMLNVVRRFHNEIRTSLDP